MADVNTNTEPTPQAQTQTQTEPKQEPTKQAEPKKDNPKQQPKYTDADVDALIGKKFAKWQEQQEAKIAEAAKLAEMNAQQKAEYERDQLQKELDDLRYKDAVSGMMAESRKQLQEKGISVDDALLSRLIADTAEETKASVDAFSELFNAAVEAGIKERLAGKAPKATTPAKAMTRDDIMAIEATEVRQRAIHEHMDLFSN